MGKNKENFVNQITNIEEDFAKWYTDIVINAGLADYTDIKGFIAIKPYGYSIWESIQNYEDKKFKEHGVKNISMPVLIPESLLNMEKDHVEGFAPEVAWVTIGGEEELEEKMCIRPTSETIFSKMYSKWLNSWRELPFLYNQWCSVYADTIENLLAIPVLKGRKTEKEQFAGAQATYTVETLMHDGRALQAATSHYFGQNFSKPFNIKFQDREGREEFAYQTSWGSTTRLIGAVIMAHGDNRGLKLPPRVAPVQAIIVPIAMHKEGVKEKAEELYNNLSKKFRMELDDREQYSPGYKFNDCEMRGIPVRIEMGPRDIENGVVVLVRRDISEKETIGIDKVENRLEELLEEIQQNMFNECLKRREEKTTIAYTLEEILKNLEENQGYVKTMWCGERECEDKVKEVTGAPSRCIPFNQEHLSDTCAICGKKAEKMIVWGRQY